MDNCNENNDYIIVGKVSYIFVYMSGCRVIPATVKNADFLYLKFLWLLRKR